MYTSSIITFDFNQVRYKFISQVAKDIQDLGGVIFGGFVRDKMIHDHFATKYYENPNNSNNFDASYSDPSWDPETVHRLLVPKDIDVWIQSNPDRFIRKIENLGYEVQKRFNRTLYGFSDVDHCSVLVKWRGSGPVLGNRLRVQVDIISTSSHVAESFGAPFGKCDLSCNGFIMTKDGIHLSRNTGQESDRFTKEMFQRHEEELKERILNLEAEIYNPKDESPENMKHLYSRAIKMKIRGWKISNFDETQIDEKCRRCRRHYTGQDLENRILHPWRNFSNCSRCVIEMKDAWDKNNKEENSPSEEFIEELSFQDEIV